MTFDYSIIPDHIRITKRRQAWRGLPPAVGGKSTELEEIRALEESGVILVDEHTRSVVNREKYFKRKRIENRNNV